MDGAFTLTLVQDSHNVLQRECCQVLPAEEFAVASLGEYVEYGGTVRVFRQESPDECLSPCRGSVAVHVTAFAGLAVCPAYFKGQFGYAIVFFSFS